MHLCGRPCRGRWRIVTRILQRLAVTWNNTGIRGGDLKAVTSFAYLFGVTDG